MLTCAEQNKHQSECGLPCPLRLANRQQIQLPVRYLLERIYNGEKDFSAWHIEPFIVWSVPLNVSQKRIKIIQSIKQQTSLIQIKHLEAVLLFGIFGRKPTYFFVPLVG